MTVLEYPRRATVTARVHAPVKPAPIVYPESDGEPMAETDTHRDQMIYLISALQDYYRDREDVYVAGNLFVYYEEGNPQAVVAPDVFVVFGVRSGERRVYKLWVEGRAPDVIFEVTSPSTRAEDLGTKQGLYAYVGVKEYFIYDPLADYLKPSLQGYRLKNRSYQPMPRLPGPADGLQSETLGVTLRVEGRLLRLYDTATGERLLTPQEAYDARRIEAEARRAAEARIAELEAELKRLRG